MRPCSKCGMLHSGKCDAPLLDKRANKPRKPVNLTLPVNLTTSPDVNLTALEQENAQLKARVAELEAKEAARTEYQREYMRKRRAS